MESYRDFCKTLRCVWLHPPFIVPYIALSSLYPSLYRMLFARKIATEAAFILRFFANYLMIGMEICIRYSSGSLTLISSRRYVWYTTLPSTMLCSLA